MTSKIENYETYNKGMFKSMQDKLFFMYRIEHYGVELVVDFGCADGSMINIMKKKLPKVKFIGYDTDEEMLRLAKKNNPNCMFTSDWSKIEHYAREYTSAITVMSTVHEVYSYGNPESVNEFWNRMYNTGFKYIVIRDMFPTVNIDTAVDYTDVKKLHKNGNEQQIQDFISVWGDIKTNRELVHFLYKYTYTDNWQRELHENYFPVNVQDVMQLIPESYNLDLFDTYILPALRNRVQKDFAIRLKHDTHCKLILKAVD